MRLALAHLGRQESLPRLLKILVPLVHQAREE
ncbi:carbon-nitrogen hydrolase family protein, partial [Thermus scotoductus]